MKYNTQQIRGLEERINAPQYLYPEFRSAIVNLVRMISQHRLPFFTYETYRTPQRQKKLISAGFSKMKGPYHSAHVHGLAVDFLIRSSDVSTSNKNEIVELVSAGDMSADTVSLADSLLIYNTGVNILGTGTTKPRTVIQNQQVLDWWTDLGALIETYFPQLVWGGKKDIEEGQHIGSDPMHVEWRDAPKLMRRRSALRTLRANGNPGLI